MYHYYREEILRDEIYQLLFEILPKFKFLVDFRMLQFLLTISQKWDNGSGL
jgi:hypothetical protein